MPLPVWLVPIIVKGAAAAAGTAVLGAASLGAGLLVGGIVFNFTGGKLSEKADEAWDQMKEAEKEINKICGYLGDLRGTASNYYNTLVRVNSIYKRHLNDLNHIVNILGHRNWNTFTEREKN